MTRLYCWFVKGNHVPDRYVYTPFTSTRVLLRNITSPPHMFLVGNMLPPTGHLLTLDATCRSRRTQTIGLTTNALLTRLCLWPWAINIDQCLSFLRWRVLRQRGSYARHTGAQDPGIRHGVVLSSNGRTRDVVRTVRELMYCYG